MRYKIVGANSRTGKETTLTVMAASEKDADRIARQSGLLVSSITEEATAPAPVAAPMAEPPPEYPVAEEPVAPQEYAAPEYLPPAAPAISYASPTGTLKEYRDLTSGARTLKSYAGVATTIGWIIIALGVLVGGLILVMAVIGAGAASSSGTPGSGAVAVGGAFAGIVSALALMIGAVVNGLLWLLIGAVLKTLAAMATTIREIARGGVA